MNNEVGGEIIRKNAAAVAQSLREMQNRLATFEDKIQHRDAQIAQLRQEIEHLKQWRQQELVRRYTGGATTDGGNLHDDH